jgi:hypothetical protein
VELAGRGFTLDALLKFYAELKTKHMPHFDPVVHTTADVVRQAIIPASSAARSSLAEVMMDGVPTRPLKMITHNWGNLFRNLVAAICADALEEAEYCRIAYMLDTEFDRVRGWLSASGKLQLTYWVCAFSVNQHCTICGENLGSAKDPVSGKVHPVCECGMPKIWNKTAPTTVDGQSINCEVNKFEDMMELLSASDPAFQQVVATDFHFTLFSRAWCVAELAAAHRMGMHQCLKFYSAHDLEEHESKLKGLKVQDMKASRPEDVLAILNHIPDLDGFNAALQTLLFEDLLPAWKDMERRLVMHASKLCLWRMVLGGIPPPPPPDGPGFLCTFMLLRGGTLHRNVIRCSSGRVLRDLFRGGSRALHKISALVLTS